MRPAIVFFAFALLLAGCGSDESTTTPAETAPAETAPVAGASSAPAGVATHECGQVVGLTKVRAIGVACKEARAVAVAWNAPRCRPSAGESRSACTVRQYRCQGVVTDRGVSVSCSQPGRSISFLRPQ
jgi:hypothetical protein